MRLMTEHPMASIPYETATFELVQKKYSNYILINDKFKMHLPDKNPRDGFLKVLHYLEDAKMREKDKEVTIYLDAVTYNIFIDNKIEA